MSRTSPGWPWRLGLVLVGAPLSAIALAVAIARWAPGGDALNRLYAGLFLGVLAQLALMGLFLFSGIGRALPVRRAWLASHSWAGAVAGTLLFVICLSGTFAVLKAELQEWERPSLQQAAGAVDPDALLAAGLARATSATRPAEPAAAHGRPQPTGTPAIVIRLPEGPRRHALVATAGAGRPGAGAPPLALRADDASPLPATHGGAAELLAGLHNHLHLGFPGRIFVSLFGFVLAFLVVGGLVLHPRRPADSLCLRRGQGLRALAFDGHRLLGLWLSPLMLLIALTGIFSGLGALATVQLAPHAFPDDPRQAMRQLVPTAAATRPSGEAATMMGLGELLRRHQASHPDFVAQSITVRHWGDAAAVAEIAGREPWQLSTALFEHYRYRLSDGVLLHHESAARQGLWTRAFIAIQPLHFAQYAGGASRWLHAAAGVALALLAASGTWLWLQRRAAQATRYQPPRRLPPQRLIPAACQGLLLACGLLLAVTALTPDDWAARPGLQAWVFWPAWIAAAGYRLLPGPEAPRSARLLRIASALFGLAGAASAAWRLATTGAIAPPALAFSLLLILAAALLWRLGRYLDPTST